MVDKKPNRPSREWGCTLAVGAGMLLMLVALTVPAVQKYRRRTALNAAPSHLRLLSRGAEAYFADSTNFVKPTRKLLPRFPLTVGPTPRANPCDSGRPFFRARTADWSHPSWRALDFKLEGRHYYRYQFSSGGMRNTAYYTAFAWADLDCDHTTSEYRISARYDPETREIERGRITVTNELE